MGVSTLNNTKMIIKKIKKIKNKKKRYKETMQL